MKKILNRLNKKQLKIEYWDKRKTLDEIASKFGCSRPTIRSWLKEYDLPCRKGSFEKGCIPWIKGKKRPPFSKEHRDKLIKANTGRIAWNKGKKGKGNSMWGRHHTDAAKQKIGAGHKGISPWCKGLTAETSESVREKGEKLRGKNHPNWQGGITSLRLKIRSCFEYRQWRSDIFTRDDFTCQRCNCRGGKLHAHHKISFNDIIILNDVLNLDEAINCEELWNINNGITLYKDCHKEIHKKLHII